MTIPIEKLEEIQDQKNKNSDFLKDSYFPIKKQHSDDIEKYLDRFITFPGFTSIISVVFTSSEFVKTPEFAIIGMILIISSLIIALNILRVSIQNDKIFIEKIDEIVKPILEFSISLTKFSRDQNSPDREKELLDSHENLMKSYREVSLEEYPVDAKRIYSQINLSFCVLVIGIIMSVLSIFSFC